MVMNGVSQAAPVLAGLAHWQFQSSVPVSRARLRHSLDSSRHKTIRMYSTNDCLMYTNSAYEVCNNVHELSMPSP